MAKGGKTELVYNDKSLSIVRTAGLLVVVGLVGYGLLVYFGYESRPSAYNPWVVLVLLAALTILGVGQYILKPSTKRALSIAMFLYYIIAAALTVEVLGYVPATYIFWLALLIATDALFGTTALIYGIGLTFVAMILFLASQPDLDSLLMFRVIITTGLMAGVAALISLIRNANAVRYSVFEQTKAREKIQRGRLSAVINGINDAIISTSASGYIRIYNAAALNLLDTNVSLASKRIDDVLHVYDQDGKPVSINELIRGAKTTIERDDLSHRFDDGQQIRLSLSVAPVRSDYGSKRTAGEGGSVLIMRDITKSKSLEEERDEFISIVSHELRTPVTIAEGTLSNLQFLLSRGGDPKALAESLDSAHSQVLLLASMINDLSTLSRVERGVGIEPEVIDVRKFMQELYQKYMQQAHDKNLRLDLDLSPTLGQVKASRLCIEEIMQNLIINAIRYTVKGGVTLIAKRQSGMIYFAVKDTGVGIGKTDQKNIFTKFWRSEDYRTRETSGSGLGLHIVQQLIQKLGTEITFTSRLNHGSTFGFELPEYKPEDDSSSS